MIGFAVVGLGMGRNRSQMIKNTEGAELKIVVDVNAELARSVAEQMSCDWSSDLDDALGRQDVDAVLVMTPSGTHAEVGIKATEAGKHVVTTKPMEVSTTACDRLISAGKNSGVKIGVDYECRYVESNFQVAHALKNGDFGKAILGEARSKWHRSDEYFEHGGGWRGTWKMDGGGSLTNQGAHIVDLLLWFMGEPERVYAETAIMSHRIETEDIGLAIVNFAGGAKGTITGTTTFPDDACYSAEVHGTDGGVLIGDALKGEMRVYGERLDERLGSYRNELHNVIEDVVMVLESDGELRVGGAGGRRTVAFLEAIYASARAGSQVTCD